MTYKFYDSVTLAVVLIVAFVVFLLITPENNKRADL